MDGKVVICSFYKSKSFQKAPEVIQQKDPNCYSTSADIYAYGCVLFEMFSGKLPHTPISNKEQVSLFDIYFE
jgi:serine/threonine protein kinase